MFDRSAHWEGVYASKSENEVSWFQENPAISLELIKQTHAVPESAIIDIGGGASRLVDALLLDKYRDITLLDLSAQAFEQAKMRIVVLLPAPLGPKKPTISPRPTINDKRSMAVWPA